MPKTSSPASRTSCEAGVAIIDHCEWIGARWYSSTKIPIRAQNGTGDVIGLIGVGRDITVQKQAELLLVEQARVIEMIARDAPLDQVLANLIGLAATHLPELEGTFAIEPDVARRNGAPIQAVRRRGVYGVRGRCRESEAALARIDSQRASRL